MTFDMIKVENFKKKWEGRPLCKLFPYQHYLAEPFMDAFGDTILDCIRAGSPIYVEFLEGARKGTIGRLKLDENILKPLYPERYNRHPNQGFRPYTVFRNLDKWTIEFDDGKSFTISTNAKTVECGDVVIRFDVEKTQSIFTRKIKDPTENVNIPKIYDHFGVQIEPDKVILVIQGQSPYTELRFAKVLSISPKGTVKIELMKTRKNHRTETMNRQNISPSNAIVFDKTVGSRFFKSRLSL